MYVATVFACHHNGYKSQSADRPIKSPALACMFTAGVHELAHVYKVGLPGYYQYCMQHSKVQQLMHEISECHSFKAQCVCVCVCVHSCLISSSMSSVSSCCPKCTHSTPMTVESTDTNMDKWQQWAGTSHLTTGMHSCQHSLCRGLSRLSPTCRWPFVVH